MLTVERYRRIGKKQRKLRSGVVVFIALLLSFMLTFGVYKVVESFSTSKRKVNDLMLSNIMIKGNEIILKVDGSSYNLSNDIDNLKELISKFKASRFSIYYKTKPIVKSSLVKPEIVVLNGKGEKNLAMNLSLVMITNNLNVVNYGNAKGSVKDSLIIVRAPIDQDYINEISSLARITNVKILIDSDILPPTTAPILVVLGKDYTLVK